LTAASPFKANSPNLDLIRASAVLCVFLPHIFDYMLRTPAGVRWNFAQLGVVIFFVHTSMALMLSMERSRELGQRLFPPFYVRRFFRIYPLSVLCVTIAFLLKVAPDPLNTARAWTNLEYVSNLALITNLTYSDTMVGGLWTLALEVQMYVLLPVLFVLAAKRPLWLTCVLWLVSLPLAIVLPGMSARLELAGYAPCFLAGIVGWRLSAIVSRTISQHWWPVCFFSTWLIFLGANREHHLLFRCAFSIALGLAIPWFRELGWQPLRLISHVIAKYSYSIYLSHIGIMLFCAGLPVNPGLRWPIFVLLSLSVPVALYHFVEEPMIRLGKGIANRVV